MNVKTINFIKQGTEPKRERTSKYEPVVKEVLSKLETMPPKQSMRLELEGKSFQPFVRKVRESVDDKKFEVYRVANELIITRKEPAKATK